MITVVWVKELGRGRKRGRGREGEGGREEEGDYILPGSERVHFRNHCHHNTDSQTLYCTRWCHCKTGSDRSDPYLAEEGERKVRGVTGGQGKGVCVDTTARERASPSHV